MEEKTKCLEETGRVLIDNNQDIVKYLCSIQEEKNILEQIIQKQYEERRRIEAEIEKLTYKLCLINKSLSMRIKSKNNYDKTIDEIKSHYDRLVISSTTLRKKVENRHQELDDIMNKKIGTGTGPGGEEIKMLYIKPTDKGKDDCSCVYMIEPPTKDSPGHASSSNPGQSSAPEKDPGHSQSKNLSNNPSKSNNPFDKPSRSHNLMNNPSRSNEPMNNPSHSNEPINNSSQSNEPLNIPYGSKHPMNTPSNSNEPIHNASSNNPGYNASLRRNIMDVHSYSNDDTVFSTNSRTTRSNPATMHNSDDEIEMASINPDHENFDLPKNFKPDGIELEGLEKPGGPLPEIEQENGTTHILLSRMRKSSNKFVDDPTLRPRGSMLLARNVTPETEEEGSNHVSSKDGSYYDSENKMEKKSVTDVLYANSGTT